MSLTHIETIELGSSQASITFSSIPQDYDDLVLVTSMRTDVASVLSVFKAEFNGVTSGYSGIELVGTGAGTGSSSFSEIFGAYGVGASATSNTFSNSSLYISNYTSANDKSISFDGVTENNASTSYQVIFAGLSTLGSGITSIELSPASFSGGTALAGSIFSLYGVTAGGSGTVTTS